MPLVEQLAEHFSKYCNSFDRETFLAVACDQMEKRELKDRCLQIVKAMEATFPQDFRESAAIIEKSLHPETEREGFKDMVVTESGIQGWAIMVLQEYVGRNGLMHPELSLELLKSLTKRLTSEFGIRYFIKADPDFVLNTIRFWVTDPNEHVRRLVSEGTRPKLPWGMRLDCFIKDPTPLIPLLEALKDDPSEYVRRSVANNLNDIAKDHPSIVMDTVERWWNGANEDRQRTIRHALRTLVKQGNPRALTLLGFESAKIEVSEFSVATAKVRIGDSIPLKLKIKSNSDSPQNLVVDYVVHLLRANGSYSQKVFKWTEIQLQEGESRVLTKLHSFAEVTVRKYYPGVQKFEIQINGKRSLELEIVLMI